MYTLLTGGAGYIGSHLSKLFLEKNRKFVIVDDLTNSDKRLLRKLEKHFCKKIPFYQIDILKKDKLQEVFNSYKFNSIIHLAAKKSVPESFKIPKIYNEVNVTGTKNLIDLALQNKIKTFIYSSSASVYGEPNYLPCDEKHPLKPLSPYASTKLEAEKLFETDKISRSNMNVIILRYFNPISSDPQSIIGEKSNDKTNNVMNEIHEVAIGRKDIFSIFGNNYPTNDGTCIRDYIHVEDLARSHIHFIEKQYKLKKLEVFNVGIGKGYSVLDLISEFNSVNGLKLHFKFINKRSGDIGSIYADVSKILNLTNWKPRYNLKNMVEDSWRYIKVNQ
jgi:UDP-glucose 4-epimerase